MHESGTCLSYKSGASNSFSLRPHQPHVCLQRAEIILGLYKCNYSLTVKQLKLHSPFEGNHEADVAPGENEFFVPVANTESGF